MVTAVKKKAPVEVKAKLIPAKAIASAAAKAETMQLATKTAKAAPKSVAKSAAKPAKRVATKSAAAGVAAPTAEKKPAPKRKSATTLTAKPVAVKTAKSNQVKPALAIASKDKHKKPKLVRDSFTMPEAEYAVLGEVKKACIAAGIEVKKSQLLRVGLVLLKQASVGSLKAMIEALPALKAGRPKVEK
ncbi:hypothetical protein [Undibacterium danionis]|uniref:Uncharacterized protein n=1 Tax=Undibacterium danionis TaxID=1812100 RepID=A0ABV6IJA3_9BURK